MDIARAERLARLADINKALAPLDKLYHNRGLDHDERKIRGKLIVERHGLIEENQAAIINQILMVLEANDLALSEGVATLDAAKMAIETKAYNSKVTI